MNKTHVIGDLHGCRNEADALLQKLGPRNGDRIIFAGDMVDLGPDSPGCLALAMQHCAIMGNHERKHVRFRKGQLPSGLAPSQIGARQQYFDRNLDYNAAVDYMEKLPLYIEIPDAIIVHAGIEFGTPMDKQDERVLTGVSSRKDMTDIDKFTGLPRWCALYPHDAKPIIFGHRFIHPAIPRAKNLFPIDTGCHRGGYLTAITLPDFTLTQVPGWDGK